MDPHGTVVVIVELIVSGAQKAYSIGKDFGNSGLISNAWYQQNKDLIRSTVLLRSGPNGLGYLKLFEMGLYSSLK